MFLSATPSFYTITLQLIISHRLSELSLSYNGGKDCLVLLILYLCALHNHPSLKSASEPPRPIQSVYIVSKHPFQEVEDFVVSSSKTCSLSLVRYAKSMKDAFSEYLHDFPSVKAIFVGTRRTDPHGADLTHFDRTDHGWPDFMRIHPVIDWQYVDIWTVSIPSFIAMVILFLITDTLGDQFIRHLNIPYCPLYDMGYTSLGGTTDTHRNPALRRKSISQPGGAPQFEFRPAYELIQDEEERLGRDWERRGAPPNSESTPQLERPREAAAENDGVAADGDGLDGIASI
jgi:FAD synthetase